MQIQIRGVTSINANASPLYVVDGVIVNNDVANSRQQRDHLAAAGGRRTPATRTSASTASPISIPTTSRASRSSRAPRPRPSTAPRRPPASSSSRPRRARRASRGGAVSQKVGHFADVQDAHHPHIPHARRAPRPGTPTTSRAVRIRPGMSRPTTPLSRASTPDRRTIRARCSATVRRRTRPISA